MITSIDIGRKLLITDIYGQNIGRLSKKMNLYGVYSNKVSFTLRHFKKKSFYFYFVLNAVFFKYAFTNSQSRIH